jgi:hypothetical protein
MVLSFDCDTDEDIPAAREVHAWLHERGARGVFAVPGAQLTRGVETFRKMANEGAEFINHGALPHTEWRDGRYWSITFYDQMTQAAVAQDIQEAHKILADAIGVKPAGFRAPHFGHFQNPAQLALIYETIRGLGYRYASTTTPLHLQRLGPVGQIDGIWELPVSGRYRNPLGLFDSWGSIESEFSPKITQQYQRLFEQNVDDLLQAQVVGVINHYVDPAHVTDRGFFYASLDHAISEGIRVVTYTELLDILEK